MASVGVAENKFLAKNASDLQKPNGFVVIPAGSENAAAILNPLSVSRLWGVGPKTGERLAQLGIAKIADLSAADPEWLARRFGARMPNGCRRSRAESIAAKWRKTASANAGPRKYFCQRSAWH